MVLFIILVGFALVLCLFYLTGKYNEHYWKKRGAAFYTENKFLGPVWQFISTDRALFEIFNDIYKKYSSEPAIGIGTLLNPTIYVRDLKNIQHVLQGDFVSFNHRGLDMYEKDFLTDSVLFMTGNRWKLMRQAMSPLFTTTKLKDMYYIVDKGAKDFVDHLKNDPSKMKGNLFNTLSVFCSAAIGAAVFGIHTKSVYDSPFLDIAIKSFESTSFKNFKLSLTNLFPFAPKLFRMILFSSYSEFFINAVKQVIRQREKDDVKRHDFADVCVAIQKNGKLRDPDTGYEIEPTDEVLAAQAFFFFAAGVEPTASAMFGVFIELGRNPDILDKVHDEIDQVWEKYHGKLTYDAINEMEYLEKVLSEALRMYPPIGFSTRKCLRDTVLPVGNIKISKNTQLFLPLYELHYDPKYYPNPELFDPERFDNDTKSGDFTYQPFGKGARICIGMRYGRLQAKTGIIHVLREFSPITTVKEGVKKFHKQQIQVRPANFNVELVLRKVKSN